MKTKAATLTRPLVQSLRGLLFLSCATAVSIEAQEAGQLQEPNEAPVQEEVANAAPATRAAATEQVLPTLRIEAAADRFAPEGAEGVWTLSSEHIRNHSKAQGNMTDLLEALPNVHFDNSRRDSDSLFNIAPPSVSIAGGRSYENNFTLDGFSINSRFDPGHNGSVTADLPGHDQAMFIDTQLIESITVYQSNIPARYGRFLGGVVNAETRSYSRTPETSIAYRLTSDSMVKARVYQISETDLTDKPSFSRDRLSIHHSRPLDEQSGLVLAFTRSSSRTPMITADLSEEAEQENYNLLAKYQRLFDSGLKADLALGIMPSRMRSYFPSYRYSEYDIHGGGLTLNSRLSWLSADNHEVDIDFGYAWKTSRREAPDHTYAWAATASKPWGLALGTKTSLEGGVGDLEKNDHGASINLTARKIWLESAGLTISYEYGGEITGSSLGYTRPNTTMNYQNALLTPGIQCRGATQDCIENEQYFTSRNVYEADDVNVSLLEAASFFEVTGEWQRWQATLGLRGDYNNYTRKLDFAPRSRISFDLFANRNSILTAGLNRYYGGAMLTYKLREARKPYYQEYRGAYQNIVNNWARTATQSNAIYRSSDLETPYSDEFSLGLRQALWGGTLSIELLGRNNHKQFSAEETGVQDDGFKVKTINNQGHGSYRSLSLGWARTLPWQIDANAMVTWSRSKSSNEDYDDEAENDGGYTHAWYNSARHAIGELSILRKNFARPVIATLQLSKRFEERLNISTTLRYESSYDNIIRTGNFVMIPGQTPEIPWETLPVYQDSYRPRIFMADASVQLKPWPRYPLTFMADIQNIGNSRTHLVAEGLRGVEVGRSYWLGFQYDF